MQTYLLAAAFFCCSLLPEVIFSSDVIDVEDKSGNDKLAKSFSGQRRQPSVAVVQWTDDDEMRSLPTSDRKGTPAKIKARGGYSSASSAKKKTTRPPAFRDLVIEKTGQRIFERFMDKVRRPYVYGHQILRDPMLLRDGLDLQRKTPLYDIALLAEGMRVRGMHNLQLTYIRVIRHYGLKDVKVNLRMETDVTIEGHYNLTGSALKFLPVTGEGPFQIEISGFSLSAVTFIAFKPEDKRTSNKSSGGATATLSETSGRSSSSRRRRRRRSSSSNSSSSSSSSSSSRLVIRELEVQVDYKDVQFRFDNMLGGGVLGSTANMVINAMGEAIIETQRDQIVKLIKTRFKEQVSAFI